MGAWADAVSVALVGTERRTQLPASVSTAVQLAETERLSAEQRVLAAGALLGASQRAGWLAPAGPGLPAPAEADPRPPAPEGAVQILELILTGAIHLGPSWAGVVAEWLERCRGAGCRIPPELLPAVLGLATRQESLRADAAPAAGARGRWLAARNPAWSWAAPAAAPAEPAARYERWATGDRAERIELLRRVRTADAEGARALLASTWATEPAADRAAFLEALGVGLGPADEPMLEAALDDRAATVRSVAADLLRRLPTSRFAARMAARATELVRLEGRRQAHLEVDLPGPADDASVRDGLPVSPPSARLAQIVGATPLGIWTEHLRDRQPKDLAWLAAAQPALLRGWTEAAIAQHDQRWAVALLTLPESDPRLLGVLPPGPAGIVLTDLLGGRNPAGPTRARDLLLACPGPWDPATSEAVVDRFRAARDKPGPLLEALPRLALALDPAAAPAVEHWLLSLGSADALRRQARMVHHALTIRANIAQEFS